MTLDACAGLVERGDRDRFLATMAGPVGARARLWPLYAFNLEVARAPWVTKEPLIAEMRLQWWRDTLAEIGAGKVARAHEVVGPLAQVIREADLPVALLDGLIVARRWDVGGERFRDRAALWAHIDATAGNLMWLCARALGAPEAAEPLVRDIGVADGLARWFLAVPELAARGRDPLPDHAPEAAVSLAREGLARLAAARRARSRVPGATATALLVGWQAQGILERAARAPDLVVSGGLVASEFARRGGLLMRAVTGRW